MDSEKLIRLVFERKSLWDLKQPQHYVRNVTTKLWAEVADEMEKPVDEVKRKWRRLRDSFRREFKKAYCEQTGSVSEKMKTWPLFSQMSFLLDVVALKKSQPFIEEQLTVIEQCEVIENPSYSIEHPICDGEAQLTLIESPKFSILPHEMFKSPAKKKKKNNYEEQFYIESEKSVFEQDNNQDSDFQFLASLLPYLRDVPGHKKLKVRAELLNVFIIEQEERDANQQPII
ncbi:uncharacterized protein LOC106667143 [Cimex lectularius]|uniref:Transcription factor Adf-1 n=1 Tax=Cimex lectularius TaxID=79782 RepID=A0A8I6THV5_CIMLE|nr:uncharacterized protein LOC106667143 [Cimex lectularius]